MAAGPLLELSPKGIYCPQGNFYLDPWAPVREAVISHAHSDHLRRGHKIYHTSNSGRRLVEHRLLDDQKYDLFSYDYDQTFEINGVSISLHPAGHVLGSSQIRVEGNGEVWVFSGDYKRADDPSCESFAPLQSDVFITEATFGLPIYRWKPGNTVVQQIYDWWQRNKELGKSSMVFGYSLGKTQRILAELVRLTNETVYIHGALDAITQIYRQEGVELLDTELVVDQKEGTSYAGKLLMSPPSTNRSRWMRRFKNVETAFASGWMRVRGRRRMGGYDKGFVISDHADWPSLISTIKQSQANEVYAIYGSSEVLTRYLSEEMGLRAQAWETGYSGEDD